MSKALSMPRGGGMRGGKKAKNPVKTFGRLVKYAFSSYKIATCFMALFVIMASVSSSTAVMFIKKIVANLSGGHPDLTGVIYPNVIIIACIYFAGAVSAFSYNLIMMYIAQGTLKKMRDEMFAKMQYLPLQYFDTHTHGDLMSLYTNDVDTMRQLLSQTIPQLISSCLTLVAVFVFMVIYSVTLLLVVLVVLTSIIFITKFVAGKSAKYYLSHQRALGNLNGFVEEMTEGQKVIKVFCHEERAREQFKVVNDELNEAGRTANKYAFILGPINNNLGYIQYVLVALVGVIVIAFGGEGGLLSIYCTVLGEGVVGMVIAFLMASRQFNMPVMQVSQQLSAIVMALAGAERIFEMVDTEPEDRGGSLQILWAPVPQNRNGDNHSRAPVPGMQKYGFA